MFVALYLDGSKKFKIVDVQVTRGDIDANIYTVTVEDKKHSFAVGDLVYVEFVQKEVIL